MNRVAVSFLAGAFAPAVALYLTGGSNRFLFSFGLILGISALLVPTLLWPRKVSSGIWTAAVATEQFMTVIRGARSQAQLPAPVTNLDTHVLPTEMQKPAVELPVHPYAGDCVSALCNLGVALKTANRTVKALVETKEYTSLEDLLRDATAASRRR